MKHFLRKIKINRLYPHLFQEERAYHEKMILLFNNIRETHDLDKVEYSYYLNNECLFYYYPLDNILSIQNNLSINKKYCDERNLYIHYLFCKTFKHNANKIWCDMGKIIKLD